MNGPAPTRLLLVHYAEIGLKGGNRHSFERRLQDRLREGLGHVGLTAGIGFGGGRFVVRLDGDPTDEDFERGLQAILRVPGVANAAPALEVASSSIEDIGEAAGEALAAAPDGTFKVETKRADKSYPMNSIEISRAVAPACLSRTGRTVDIRNPDVTVRVEVTKRGTYVSAHRIQGPGGLPVGSTGRLLSFLSGGLDSAVASWLMLRRGARVMAVHFHNRTLQGEAVLEKLADTCRVLAWAAGRMPLLVVPFEESQKALVQAVPAEYRMIVYRRAMFRIGDALARREHALGFVTGDSLGQVASQTAENIRTIHAAATLPVYTPLAGSDKAEIIHRAREIGTYDISIRPHEDCCSFLIAKHPAVKSRLDEIATMESVLDWDALVTSAVEGTERLTFTPNGPLAS